MRILYGLPSEGMGHATRSQVIISHLIKEHDVRIVTSDRAYKFMNEQFPGRVYEIKGFHLAYKDGSVAKRSTVSMLLKNGPKDLISNFHKYRLVHKEFKADLVISDFESFTFLFAKFHKLPLISVDNIQVINRCKLDIPVPKIEKKYYLIANNIIKAKVPRANYYLITSFFNAELRKKNTSLVPPILRDKILNAKVRNRDHVIVYQTSSSQSTLVSMLNRIQSVRFIVYGFNKSEIRNNVEMKKFSENGFIDDLASARAVITNGGFSLISEAIYFRKPLCSVPISGQFEQYVNAAYIEKCGYGRHFSDFSADAIKAFLFDLDLFQENLNKYTQDRNNDTLKKLDDVIDMVAR